MSEDGMGAHVNAAARSLILGRVRDILGERSVSAAADYEKIARDYQQASALDSAGRIELFVERLLHYQVGVHRCAREALARTIATVLAARGASSAVVPSGLPGEWLPAHLTVIRDEALTAAELDRSEGVVTACSVAIASTGTIVLRHAGAEGRRALTLVPDYHLCVVFHDQIVQSVPEAVRALSEWKPALVTTISGPSATADIEMTRIRGVHGPRTLDAIIVEP